MARRHPETALALPRSRADRLAACLVAMLLAGRAGGRVRWRYPLTAVVAVVLIVLTGLKDDIVPVPFEASKPINREPGGPKSGEHRWHVVARVDVTPRVKDYASFGGARTSKTRSGLGAPAPGRRRSRCGTGSVGIFSP